MTPEGPPTRADRRKQNRPVVRLTAVIVTCLFGSLWLAMVVARDLAPPEPEFAGQMRWLCLVLFVLSLGWSAWLYWGWRTENRGGK